MASVQAFTFTFSFCISQLAPVVTVLTEVYFGNPPTLAKVILLIYLYIAFSAQIHNLTFNFNWTIGIVNSTGISKIIKVKIYFIKQYKITLEVLIFVLIFAN